MYSHRAIAACWVAFNRGWSTVSVPVRPHRRMDAYEIHCIPKESMRGARLSYRGDTIYSHHWWPFARFVNDSAQRPTVVLFRDETYSMSTSKHQHHVRNAVRDAGVQMFSFPHEPTLDHNANIASYQTRIFDQFNKALRARQHAVQRIERAAEIYDQMRKYLGFFNLPEPVWANPFASDAELVKLEAKLTKLSIGAGVSIRAFWKR